jgi:hypothetical protein
MSSHQQGPNIIVMYDLWASPVCPLGQPLIIDIHV